MKIFVYKIDNFLQKMVIFVYFSKQKLQKHGDFVYLPSKKHRASYLRAREERA